MKSYFFYETDWSHGVYVVGTVGFFIGDIISIIFRPDLYLIGTIFSPHGRIFKIYSGIRTSYSTFSTVFSSASRIYSKDTVVAHISSIDLTDSIARYSERFKCLDDSNKREQTYKSESERYFGEYIEALHTKRMRKHYTVCHTIPSLSISVTSAEFTCFMINAYSILSLSVRWANIQSKRNIKKLQCPSNTWLV